MIQHANSSLRYPVRRGLRAARLCKAAVSRPDSQTRELSYSGQAQGTGQRNLLPLGFFFFFCSNLCLARAPIGGRKTCIVRHFLPALSNRGRPAVLNELSHGS